LQLQPNSYYEKSETRTLFLFTFECIEYSFASGHKVRLCQRINFLFITSHHIETTDADVDVDVDGVYERRPRPLCPPHV